MRAIPPVLGILLIAGCGPDHVYLRPAASEVVMPEEGPPAVRLRVPPQSPGGLDLLVSSFGAFERKEYGETVTTVEVRVGAENRGGDEAALLPAQSYILDRQGRMLRPTGLTVGGEAVRESVALKPGDRRVIDFFFDVTSEPRDPDDLAPLRFVTSATVEGKTFNVTVPFVELPRYPYAPAYYYSYPYYAPYWYDPYPYYPRVGVGVGVGAGFPLHHHH